ncbi:MAG TPA: DNA internalization-related competence protein ComEC/Rec2 [Virgibacillus sp.]|nr:DNA internalization-related competence protein ComEC/Rec2 [Virgibacillus sp.]
MRGYWHFTAISVAISFLTIYFQNYWFIIGFFLWLSFLYYYQLLGKVPIIVSFVFFLFFMVYIPAQDKTENTLYDDIPPIKQTTLTGQIIRPAAITQKKVDFLFQNQQSEEKISVVFFPDQATAHANHHHYTSWKHGATCKITGKLEHPSLARNPGQFDFQTHLLQQGITYQLILQSLDDIDCKGSSFLDRFYTIRANLINHINKTLSPETAGWLNGLVLGDDSFINEDITDLFQRWSLSHILAISGLHVGLVVALVYFMLIKLNIVTKEKAQWLMILFLPIYALLAGGAPSVWRASTMVLLFIILNKIKVKFSVTDTLSLVFLLLILFDKYIVYHVGFQLSFIVTFGIILSKHWIGQSNSRVLQGLQISFVSQMMILPLQLAYFSTFQPLSILLNFLVVPYFSLFVIPYMFILLVLSFLPSILIQFFDLLFVRVHRLVMMLVEFIDEYADYPFIIGEVPIELACIYYALFFTCMRSIQKFNLKKAFIYGCYVSLAVMYLAVRPYLSPFGTVTMLDIGQGDAFVIELPYRKGVIFMDAGASFSFEDFQPTEKVYDQIMKPYLYSRGISKINAVFLSHEDIDHMGSVPYMIKDMGVDEIFISNYYELDAQTALQWRNKGAQIKQVSYGKEIIVRGQSFRTIAPMKDMNSPNENSLVIYTKLGGMRWLFTGDIGVDAEKEIIKTYGDLSADILKVGHHGSNTSTDEAFVKQLNPRFALISVGENNTYGHPAKEVLETLEDANVKILRTDEHGAVQFRFKKNEQGTFTKYLP